MMKPVRCGPTIAFGGNVVRIASNQPWSRTAEHAFWTEIGRAPARPRSISTGCEFAHPLVGSRKIHRAFCVARIPRTLLAPIIHAGLSTPQRLRDSKKWFPHRTRAAFVDALCAPGRRPPP